MRRTFAFATLVLSGAIGAIASDAEYGADGLAYLARHSDLVVRVARARPVASGTPRFASYDITVDSVVRGEAPPKGPLTVYFPASFDVSSSGALEQSILFLLSEESTLGADPTGAGGRTRRYVVVGGRYGVVDLASNQGDLRQKEVASFLRAESAGQRLEWAERSIQTEDPFLERSALLELTRPEYRDDDRAVAVVADAVRAGRLMKESLPIAVDALQSSERPAALLVLKDLAETQTDQPLVRDLALRAMPSLPGGMDQLRELSNREGILRHSASELLREVAGLAREQLDRGAADSLQHQVQSTDPTVRLNALETLRRSGPTPELLKAYKDLFQLKSWAGTTLRLSILEEIPAFASGDAAVLLKEIALDDSQPIEIRRRAIQNLSKFETGLSGPILQQLSLGLNQGDLKILADRLSHQ